MELSSSFATVNPKKKETPTPTESVKISRDVVNLVREDKKKTKLPIGAFFELAALEKLNKKSNA